MRRDSARAAWTRFVAGAPQSKEPLFHEPSVQKKSKYKNVRVDGFASKKEARVAGELKVREAAGDIRDLQMQVWITIVEGRDKIRPIRYVADFTYYDKADKFHILDAKGWKTDVYKLKKKALLLLKGIEIEEV